MNTKLWRRFYHTRRMEYLLWVCLTTIWVVGLLMSFDFIGADVAEAVAMPVVAVAGGIAWGMLFANRCIWQAIREADGDSEAQQ